MSSSCCLTSCGTSTKFFNVGPQHPLLNLLRHQNFLLGAKSIHKYQSKCHSFFLPPVISCKFYPLRPQANSFPQIVYLPTTHSPQRLWQKIVWNSTTHHPPLTTSVTPLMFIVSLILNHSSWDEIAGQESLYKLFFSCYQKKLKKQTGSG